MFRIESLLVLAAVAIAFVFPRLGSPWFQALEERFARLARNRAVAVLVVGLTALGARVALLPLLPRPQPVTHDEFSYLLAADTFTHGRLANPPHPMWIHFETFHVIWHPTYASMYQPAQGLVLAAGQVLAGHPFWGVWLSVGAMCAALCWMLQGWLPPAWALLGGFLAVIRLGTFSYWSNSYWGGAVAATGGALVFGALPRLKEKQHLRDAVLMGVGLAVLANTRPYEGLLASLPVAVALFVWILGRSRPPLQVSIRRVLVPLGLLLAMTAAGLGYYCWRVTGDPFRLPQQLNRETYASAPYFLWESPRPQPIYHHKVMRDFYQDWELGKYMNTRSVIGLLGVMMVKAYLLWEFYLGPLFTLPLLIVAAAVVLLPGGFRWSQISEGARFLLLASAAVLAGLSVEVYFTAHYAAPMTCLILALILLSMRRLRAWRWRGKASGLLLTRAIPLVAVLMLFLRAGGAALHFGAPSPFPLTWCSPRKPDSGRARILAQLEHQPGDHLVLVRYGPDRNPSESQEWVYNQADIDKAKVVWARDMGAAENQELIRYFNRRSVWLVEPDKVAPHLQLYGAPETGELHRAFANPYIPISR
jgi:hypothetical protein